MKQARHRRTEGLAKPQWPCFKEGLQMNLNRTVRTLES